MTKERAYTPSLVLHVLRNTYGWNAEAIRQARLDAADEIERLQTLLIRVLEDGEPSQDLLQEIDEAVTEPTHEPPKIDWDAVEQAKKADAAAFANTWGEIKAHTSEPLPVDPLASVDCWLESYCGLVHPQAQKALRDIIDAGASRDASSPGACAVDPRDAVIAELTKWADDWAVYRGPAEKPVDKGWRLAAEELQSILKKSATRTNHGV